MARKLKPPYCVNKLQTESANKARLDNRRGSTLSSMISFNFNINPALDAQCRPGGAIA